MDAAHGARAGGRLVARWIPWLAGCWLVWGGAGFMRADTACSFTLQERFGVSHREQPVEFAYRGGPLEPARTRMIGPDGREVPFQQLSSGNILVRTRLPGSLKSLTYHFWRNPDWTPPTSFTLDLSSFSRVPPDGTPARLQSLYLPESMDSQPFYFIKQSGSSFEFYLDPALTSRFTFPESTYFTGYMNTSGWVVDPADPAGDTLYAQSHSYETGDPVRLLTGGRLPRPLQTGTEYFVIRLSSQRFRLASTPAEALAGTTIELEDAGEGVFETETIWTWRLEQAVPAAGGFAGQVEVADTGDSLEVTNGSTGLRLIKTEGNPEPYHLAPVQAVQMTDGSWSQDRPNYLYEPPAPGCARQSTIPIQTVTGYTLKILEQGPLMVKAEARYQLNRPEDLLGGQTDLVAADPEHDTLSVAGHMYNWEPWRQVSLSFRANGGTLPGGFLEKTIYWTVFNQYDPVLDRTTLRLSTTIDGPPVDITGGFTGTPCLVETQLLAGPGFFKETVTVQAGEKSILINDEADTMVEYFLNFHRPGVFVPDLARYRPHTVYSMECGYELQDGVKVPYSNRTCDVDVYRDIGYAADMDSGGCSCGPVDYPCLMGWYTANSALNTGWYWLFYDSAAEADAPLVGFFQGRVSEMHRIRIAGPGMYSSPAHFANEGRPAAGVHMHLKFRDHALRMTQLTRREWGLHVSTKSGLKPTGQIQPIGPERHSLAAVNLTHLASYALDFPDPEGGWPPPYMEREAYGRMVERYQLDEYYRMASHWSILDLRDMWAGIDSLHPSEPCYGTAADVERIVSRIEQLVWFWQEKLVNGNGPFDFWWTGYQPGMQIMQQMPRVLAVLNFPPATPVQRERAKAAAAWLACVYWDNEYLPLDSDTGEGMGNPNQAVQLYQFRAANSLAYPSHPVMAARRQESLGYAEAGYSSYLHPDSGVPRGSCHYQIAGMDSVLTTFLLMKGAGISMAEYPLWQKYGEFMLDSLSPPDPRFGGVRKIVSIGDGATKGIAMLGMVAGLIREVNPPLASWLQWGWWEENGKSPESARLFEYEPVPSALVIDEQAPQSPAPLLSRHYDGYWSVLRSGARTPGETGAWFANGNWLSDHRHNDGGQVSLYAHTAPLATDWNAHWWNPETSGGYMHNRINREADLDKPWNADNTSLLTGTPHFVWPAKGEVKFVRFLNSAQSVADHGPATLFSWTRMVRLMAPDRTLPVIWVTDSFQDSGAEDAKILTWNLWAEGKVETPAGEYTPVVRFNTTQSGEVNAYPSNGPVYDLGAGPQRFHFTGHPWPAHETGGIDFDLYLVPDGSQQFYIGNWGHNSVFGNEAPEFRYANNGTAPEERQHILRVRGNGSFSTLILPYRKGERPADLTVRQEGADYVIGWAGNTLRLNANFSYFSAPVGETAPAGGGLPDVRQIFTAYNATGGTAGEYAASGGPLEIVREGDTVTLTAHGPAGERTFRLPGCWTLPAGIGRTGPGTYGLEYSGGEAQSWTLTSRPVVLPAVPSGLRAALTDAGVSLSWVRQSTDETGFRIERRSGSGNEWQLLAETAAGSSSYHDLAPGAETVFVYRVRAVNWDGASAPSNEAAVTLPALPAAPASLSSVAIAPDRIDLIWLDRSGNETGFAMERRLVPANPAGCKRGEEEESGWVQIAVVNANPAGYSDTGLTAATEYGYRVRAFNAAGGSGYSNESNCITPAPGIPGMVTNLRAIALSASQIELTWTDNAAGEAGFRLERKTGPARETLTVLPPDTVRFTDGNLAAGTLYGYRLTAFNGTGEAAPSNEASARTFSRSGMFSLGGYLGIGRAAPERAIHIQGANAVFRMDRSRDTAAFMITRTEDGGGILKTFLAGVNAAGVNQGSFVINDLGSQTTGGGTARLSIASGGTAVFGREIRARGFITASSRLYKRNIQPLDQALETVLRLQGVTFRWREGDRPAIGLIAEEVERTLPALVFQFGGSGAPAGLDQARLTALLLEAIKARQRQIEELKKRRDYLNSLLNRLGGPEQP